MKKDNKALDEKLQHYLDGTLSGGEKEVIEKLLQTDETVKAKHENLLMIDQFLRQPGVVNVSPDFTQRVMSRVDALPVSQPISIRFPIILMMVIVAIAGVAVWFLSRGLFDKSVMSVDPHSVTWLDQHAYKLLPTVSFNGKMMIKVMIFLNAATALIFLDRAVLKPFFKRRLARS